MVFLPLRSAEVRALEHLFGFHFICFIQGSLLLYISLFSHRDISVYLLYITSFVMPDDYKVIRHLKHPTGLNYRYYMSTNHIP